MLTISIAICTYNGETYLREQLDSYVAQTRLPDDVVVCDDCSKDSTQEILTAFAGSAPFPVKLYFNEQNLNYIKNFEKAIGLCTGDIIVLSDQDDVWRSDKLELMEAEFAKSEKIGLVYADAEVVDEYLRLLNLTMWQGIGFNFEKQEDFSSGRAFDNLLKDGYVYGSSMAFRAKFRHLIMPIPSDILFLRHLVVARQNGLLTMPQTIAELGPGESIGSGLVALLSGAERYFAFDVIEHANLQRNLEIYDELVELFKRKEPIPGEDEFPEAKPRLKSYEFPSEILTDELLNASLEPTRLNQIRESIINYKTKDSLINYVAPWDDAQLLEKESVDMIFSQAVMEHVANLPFTYKAFSEWLKPNGFMSHQIDFRCHGTAEEWNGHWAYSDFTWKLIQGSRSYLLNREPHSTHLKLLQENGFKIVFDEVFELPSKLSKRDLAERFDVLSDGDLTASGAFVQSVKTTR